MKRLGPMAMLFVAVAVFSAFQFASVAAGTPRPEVTARLTSFGSALAFVVWVAADARERGRTPCYEFGFLVAVYFPLSLVWYVLWSRGWRGVVVLAALFGLMLLPVLSATAAWVLR